MLESVMPYVVGAALMLFAGVPFVLLLLALFVSVADRPEPARPHVTVTYNIDARAIHYAPPPPTTWAGPPALALGAEEADDAEPVYLPQWREGARLALPAGRTVYDARIQRQ